MKPRPKQTGLICPECGNKLVERKGKFGLFIGCSGYPHCGYIKKDEGKNRIEEMADDFLKQHGYGHLVK